MRLNELAGLFQLLGFLADARARRHHEQRQVVARLEDVVAEAQAVVLPLPAELERMWLIPKEMDRIAVALGLEELPDRLHLHPAGGVLLDLLDLVEKVDRLIVMSRKG